MKELSRRTFLKTAGVAATGAFAGGYHCVTAAAPPLPRIGLQLYTVREAMATDPAGTLTRIAEMGYDAVETAFFPEGMTIKQAGKLLRDSKLSVFAAHVEIPVGDHKDAFLEIAEAYECEYMVWHGWPEDERYQTTEGIKRLADIYNEAYVFATEKGLRFGIHNHWWEFQPNTEGELPYTVLRPLIDPGIFFEIDTYWTLVAGLDPARVVRDFGNRAPLLHIKDSNVLTTEGPMVAAGQGVQDFPAIAEAGRGSTEWMIVELDACETDMFDAAAQSYTYLTENGLARGST